MPPALVNKPPTYSFCPTGRTTLTRPLSAGVLGVPPLPSDDHPPDVTALAGTTPASAQVAATTATIRTRRTLVLHVRVCTRGVPQLDRGRGRVGAPGRASVHGRSGIVLSSPNQQIEAPLHLAEDDRDAFHSEST